jgi:hypothetical protein
MPYTERVCIHCGNITVERVVDAPYVYKNTFNPDFEYLRLDYKHTPYFLKPEDKKNFSLDADF